MILSWIFYFLNQNFHFWSLDIFWIQRQNFNLKIKIRLIVSIPILFLFKLKFLAICNYIKFFKNICVNRKNIEHILRVHAKILSVHEVISWYTLRVHALQVPAACLHVHGWVASHSHLVSTIIFFVNLGSSFSSFISYWTYFSLTIKWVDYQKWTKPGNWLWSRCWKLLLNKTRRSRKKSKASGPTTKKSWKGSQQLKKKTTT